MIVIVILGILAGIVLFAVGGITDRGTTAACKTDVSTIQTGVEAYYAKTPDTTRAPRPDADGSGVVEPVPEVGRGLHGYDRRDWSATQ